MSSSDDDTVTYNGINSVKSLQLLENSKPIKVSVGSSGNMSVWYLPKKLLVEYSTFFAAALNGYFAEGKTDCVTLPEEDPDIFRIFVQWLYRGGALDESESIKLSEEYPEKHIRTWALGDKLGCSKLQDTAILQIIEFDMVLCTNLMEINSIHELTAPSSLLREFAFDQFRWNANRGFAWHEEDFFDFENMSAFTPEDADGYWCAATHTSDDYEPNPTDCVERYLEDPKFRVNFGHLANECPDLHHSM